MTSDSRLAQDPHSPRSRAFLFGESVFTTLRVENGHLYFAEQHLKRLKESADWLWPGTASQVDQLWSDLKAPGKNGVWRLTLFAMQVDRQMRLSEAPVLELDSAWSEGLPVPQKFESRTVNCSSRSNEWPAFLKSGDYLARLVAARHLGKNEIPLFIVEQEVAEFLHANIFVWFKNQLVTPPVGPNVLAGVGRERLIHLAKSLGIECLERSIKRDELTTADQIWAVNAVRGIVEVSQIDSRPMTGHALSETFQQRFFAEV